VGGKGSKRGKTKKKRVGGGEKIKFPKNKTEIRAEKGQRKTVNLGCHRDREGNPASAPSIQVSALVGAGSLWPAERTCPFVIQALDDGIHFPCPG
jgi:hypothetical protein